MIESFPPVYETVVPRTRAGKPSLSAVARAARVSLATASYALRCDPKIPPATRERVCAVAKQLGYTRNPELGRLMFLLRGNHAVQSQANLALLSLKGHRSENQDFSRELVTSIRERGARLGYSVDVIEADPARMSAARLTQVLLSRGIRGVILAPLAYPTDCTALLDWGKFTAVSTTGLAGPLGVNRIVPHHLQITELALERLSADGHRRIGWIASESEEHGEYALTLAAHALARSRVPVELLSAPRTADPATLAAWCCSQRPDSLLVANDGVARETEAALANMRRPPPLFVLNRSPRSRWPGVDQHPGAVGKLAVDSLAHLLQAGEHGGSDHTAVTMVEGSWQSAATRPESICPGLPGSVHQIRVS